MNKKEKLNELFDSLKKMMGEPEPKKANWQTPIPDQFCPICKETAINKYLVKGGFSASTAYGNGIDEILWKCKNCGSLWGGDHAHVYKPALAGELTHSGGSYGLPWRGFDPTRAFKQKFSKAPEPIGHNDSMSSNETLYLAGVIGEELYLENELGQNAPVSQQELSKLYPKGKVMNFIKNIPVALAPFKNLEQMFGAEKASEIAGMAGEVDKVPSYNQTYQQNGYVVFQYDSKGNKPDIYIADPGSVSKNYTKFEGQLPTDPKSRGKIPSLVVLDKLGLDANKVPFFVKKVPTEMISADEVGLANKVIQTSWGEQAVQSGGFLVREPNGHIYTVAPDASGLPIGYIKA